MDEKLNAEFRAEVRESLKDIRTELKVISDFRGQVIGGAGMVAFLVSILVAYLKAK